MVETAICLVMSVVSPPSTAKVENDEDKEADGYESGDASYYCTDASSRRS